MRDHAKVLTAHNDTMRLIELRVTAIEQARQARQIEEVRREEREEARDAALRVRLTSIDQAIATVQTDVKGIKGAGLKLAWIVVALVVGTVIAFTLRGGFVL